MKWLHISGQTGLSAYTNYTDLEENCIGKSCADSNRYVVRDGKYYSNQPRHLFDLGVGENGAELYLYNKTEQGVVVMKADDYGNGYVGAFDRKGQGRVLNPK